jgi:hypothetical protein
MSEEQDIVKAEKVAAVKRCREKANGYREKAQQNRELVASMLKRADQLELDAIRFEMAADALELEVSGAW